MYIRIPILNSGSIHNCLMPISKRENGCTSLLSCLFNTFSLPTCHILMLIQVSSACGLDVSGAHLVSVFDTSDRVFGSGSMIEFRDQLIKLGCKVREWIIRAGRS